MTPARTLPAQRPIPLSRRQFLARCGALGAVAMAAQLPGASLARGSAAAQLIEEAGPALRLLALDTLAGLVAFVVPGPDRYSEAQGLTHVRPGGVAARAPEGLVDVFDSFVPLSDSFAQALAAALAAGMSEVPMPALGPVMQVTEETAATVDRALQAVLANDETVPLSLLVALTLNLSATSVNPGAVAGPFPSAPFANLKYAEKAEVFRRMEEENAELVALLDGEAPEPMRGSFSGAVEFMAGALLGGAALYSYGEYGVFDPDRRRATSRPVGWELSRYALGRTAPADGWREFKGYYRGRRKARPTRRPGPGPRKRRRDA